MRCMQAYRIASALASRSPVARFVQPSASDMRKKTSAIERNEGVLW